MKLHVIFNLKFRNTNEQMISGNILMQIYQECSLLSFAENLSFKKSSFIECLLNIYMHSLKKKPDALRQSTNTT